MIFAGEICLITENVPRLVEFYEKVLQTSSEGNEIHATLGIKGGTLAVYSKTAASNDMGINFDKFHGTGMFTFGFTVDNVDYEYERLKNLNIDINFVIVPSTHPWGARTMHFRDVDGNIVFMRQKIF
jgi:uncharacterized glyoxalase superfamily protein PhnB